MKFWTIETQREKVSPSLSKKRTTSYGDRDGRVASCGDEAGRAESKPESEVKYQLHRRPNIGYQNMNQNSPNRGWWTTSGGLGAKLTVEGGEWPQAGWVSGLLQQPR
jgi:hypothetical protein